jgi:riboflavin synthase
MQSLPICYAYTEPQATLMIGSLKIDTTRLLVRIEEDELSLDKELVGIVHNTDREHDLKVMRMHWNLLDYPYLAPKR